MMVTLIIMWCISHLKFNTRGSHLLMMIMWYISNSIPGILICWWWSCDISQIQYGSHLLMMIMWYISNSIPGDLIYYKKNAGFLWVFHRHFQNIYITNTDITQQHRRRHYLYIHFQYKHMKCCVPLSPCNKPNT